MGDFNELLTFLCDPSSGTRLSQDEYTRDFGDRLWLADEADTWKLERPQFYDETGFPSWDAFAAGNWDRSLELYEAMRPELRSFFRKYEERGSRFCRIRVIETPLTPYLQWKCIACGFEPSAASTSASFPPRACLAWNHPPAWSRS
jgi:hypothetical protein